MLFCIEGLDGSGKTTQTQLLKEYFESASRVVRVISFPNYNSVTGRMVKEYLRGSFGNPVTHDPFEATFLFAADRLALKDTILESLARDEVVILNRFVLSNISYGMSKIEMLERGDAEREKFVKFNWQLEFGFNELPVPHQTFFLDISPEMTLERVNSRSISIKDVAMTIATDTDEAEQRDAHARPDEFEKSQILQQLTRKNYMELAARGYCELINCDGKTEDQVHKEILARLKMT